MQLDPIILFFLLGVFAGLIRSELRLPAAVYELVSTVLLLAIGMKGGVELAAQPLLELLPDMVAVIAMGIVLTLVAFPVLRVLGGFSRVDAAAVAAHYGSVSVGTYAVAVAWLGARGIDYEEQLPLLLVLLEVPAILIGIALARGEGRDSHWGAVVREIFTGKSIVLLLGGLAIGWVAGRDGLEPLSPLFFDLFKGVLALFLLDMGLIAATHFPGVRRHGLFLVAFAVLMPLLGAVIGTLVAAALGFSLGGMVMLATLAASASYIAAPAAMRISVPEANPGLSLTAALGVTFPFNVLVGIPIYHALAHFVSTRLAGGLP